MSEIYEDEYGDYEDDYVQDNQSMDYQVEESYRAGGNEYSLKKKKSVIFVMLDDIKSLINNKCSELNELLGLERDEALQVLNHFQWRKDRIENDWFGNEDQCRLKAGIDPSEIHNLPPSGDLTCTMCFEEYPRSEFELLKCNHILCKECFSDYVNFQVTRPENLFFWKCPGTGCNLVIPESVNLKYLRKEHINKYNKKLAISYADSSKSLRWCPGPGCENGVEVESIVARAINCPCGFVFCFKCGLEDHQPCDCDTTKEWTKRDQGGGANAKWLLAYTKDCPKCKKAIEKNQGCNYMRCRHPGCNFEFCWLCLADWKTHNDHFKCNKYDKLSKDEKDALDGEKQKERSDLQKYAFYYERYTNNHVAMNSADKIMTTLKKEQKDIAINLNLTLTQLEYLLEACQILKNAKRILKWSYAYGFYLENDLQRNLYEIIQEKLDIYSGELHVLLETKYDTAKKNIGDFTEFKSAVLAAVFKTKQNMENFLTKMEEFENSLLEEELKKRQSTEEAKENEKSNSVVEEKTLERANSKAGGRRKAGEVKEDADDNNTDAAGGNKGKKKTKKNK